MKIGIITLYYKSKNIGGLLQSYAMVQVLNLLGYEAEQISYDSSVTTSKINEYIIQRKRALLKKSSFKAILKRVTAAFNNRLVRFTELEREQIRKQDNVLAEFEGFIPHSSVVFDETSINNANDYYDLFLVGSDQVWNTSMLMRSAYYLSFTTKNKIAYAVSMGKSEIINLEKQLFREKLKGFTEISVREKSMANLIENISSVKCTWVLDPTLLLSYEKWKDIENNSILPKKPYVFCYFLGDCSWQRKMVQKFSDSNNLMVVDLPYIMKSKRKSDCFLRGTHYCNVGPREFVSLIKNAEYVFTDSFHAVAFSVNFQTNFYVFDRDGLSGGESINSRITDFLDMLMLTDRRIISFKDSLDESRINWETVKPMLEEQRAYSKKWLQNQLLNCKEKQQ